MVTYEIKVGNDGTDPVTGVKVRDTLPAGARYIEATGTEQLPVHAGLTASSIASAARSPANTPTAAGADDHAHGCSRPTRRGPTSTRRSSIRTTPFPKATSSTTRRRPQTIDVNQRRRRARSTTSRSRRRQQHHRHHAGGPITYTLTVSNVGDPALNVAVRDVLPAGVTFVSATDGWRDLVRGAFTCSQAGGVVDCTGATHGGHHDGSASARGPSSIKVNGAEPEHRRAAQPGDRRSEQRDP